MKKAFGFSIFALFLLIPCTMILSACSASHTHQFSEWNVITAATCTTEGQEERSCSCGETNTRTIAALGHTETVLSAKDPTCTLTGLTEGKICSTCQTILAEQFSIPAIGHSFDMENHVCSTCQATLTNISSMNDFSAYDGARNAVIYLDKCIDTSSGTSWSMTIAPGTDHVRLIGTAGTKYNLCIKVDEAREKAMTIDFINVTLASSKKNTVVQYNGIQELSLCFYGTECGITGRTGDNGVNAGILSNFSMNGDSGSSGEVAVQAGGALRLVVSADQVEIRGGNGGNGGNGMDAAPSPQSGGNGGNGGNGAQSVQASSIDVYLTDGRARESILFAGGAGGNGGSGGSKFLFGSNGSTGNSGTSATPTNIEPTYH